MTRLLHMPWCEWPSTHRLIGALGAPYLRFVGGAVRDAWLGITVSDVDIATSLVPADVLQQLGRARIKAVPTGFAHGTVTAVIDHQSFEITTLRHDVSTDGRHAVVAFTDDWQADAARRDFTINALYADVEGTIFDYFGGLADLAARRVRFIGDPVQRITEDALRILRFFRFSARFAAMPLDVAGLAACTARRHDLLSLSRERIRDEFLKLLGCPQPVAAIEAMQAADLFAHFLPEMIGPADLSVLVQTEAKFALSPEPLRRLASLLPRNSELMADIAARLKFSNAQRKRLIAMTEPTGIDDKLSAQATRASLYRTGKQTFIDQLLLSAPDATRGAVLLAQAEQWSIPTLPFKGSDLIARGVTPGRDVSRLLRTAEDAWVAADFPISADKLAALLDAIMVKHGNLPIKACD